MRSRHTGRTGGARGLTHGFEAGATAPAAARRPPEHRVVAVLLLLGLSDEFRVRGPTVCQPRELLETTEECSRRSLHERPWPQPQARRDHSGKAAGGQVEMRRRGRAHRAASTGGVRRRGRQGCVVQAAAHLPRRDACMPRGVACAGVVCTHTSCDVMRARPPPRHVCELGASDSSPAPR